MEGLLVEFRPTAPRDELVEKAKDNRASLREVPGLIQKFYLRPEDKESLAGFYLFDSPESLERYRENTLPQRIAALDVEGEPSTRRFEVDATLYEQK